ncbi:MAG: GntR family transcriptional regulator [Actinomycetia bacterium]|nr:GntR family transcriptional regulator [Actinomycetes bacterium]
MVITLQLDSTTPLYQQIQAQVIAGIANGELTPGEQLPSVRALAAQLGINLHTVNKAYNLLQDGGYVIIQGRAGARIADPAGQGRAARVGRAREAIACHLRRAAQEAAIWGISREEFMGGAADEFDMFDVFGKSDSTDPCAEGGKR